MGVAGLTEMPQPRVFEHLVPFGGHVLGGCDVLEMWVLAVRGGLLGMDIWGLESELLLVQPPASCSVTM